METWIGGLGSLAQPTVWLALAALVALVATDLVLRGVAWAGRRLGQPALGWTVEASGRALRLLVPAFAVRAALPAAALPGRFDPIVDHATELLLIGGAGWLLVSLTLVFDRYLHARFVLDVADNLAARRIHTKFRLIRRTLVVVIGVVSFAAMLTTFPAARSVGTGLLASAGIAGLALGIAARPTIETLIAGVQIALTGPINIDDVVIVEGEWGRIEEITATYVVVCIWDLRRLILPIQYFISQPFQNWTRVTADLLGQVTLDVDYATPVDAVRSAAERIVRDSALWDGKFWNLVVLDAGERSLRLRVLVSAPDASTAFDLRCEVREKLIAWLQEHHPEALPRIRVAAEPGRA